MQKKPDFEVPEPYFFGIPSRQSRLVKKIVYPVEYYF